MNIVAIGDVHGCITKLQKKIQPLIGSQSEVVFLGDLIDRSPDHKGDLRVLQLVKFMEQNPQAFGLSKVVVLSGNHEQIFLGAYHRGLGNPYGDHWLANGGDPSLLQDAEPFIDWLKARPLTYFKDKYLFVHAGVRPHVPIEKQNPNDLIWIRDDFLNADDHGLPYVVVHGHTPTERVEITPNRIGIDTGACFGGELTALSITL